MPDTRVVAFFKAATMVPKASWGPKGQAIWNKVVPEGPWGMFVVWVARMKAHP